MYSELYIYNVLYVVYPIYIYFFLHYAYCWSLPGGEKQQWEKPLIKKQPMLSEYKINEFRSASVLGRHISEDMKSVIIVNGMGYEKEIV